LGKKFEERFIRPIINASYLGTLAALCLNVLQRAREVTGSDAPPVRILIVLGSIMFLPSSFSIFFYTIYPTKRKLWTTAAISFLTRLTERAGFKRIPPS
jgi:hypothetical protein